MKMAKKIKCAINVEATPSRMTWRINKCFFKIGHELRQYAGVSTIAM
jgi:hypothetical protein